MVVGLLSRFARGKVGGDEKQTIEDRLLKPHAPQRLQQ